MWGKLKNPPSSRPILIYFEFRIHSLLSFAWTLTRPTNFNLLRQNIVFSYSQRISVSFSWLIDYFSFFFCYFTLLLIFTKIILLLLFYYIFFSWKLFLFFHVPGCSGMFRNVPCSGFYRRPAILGVRLTCLECNLEGQSRTAFYRVNMAYTEFQGIII